MASEEEKSGNDLYAVLGLRKECSDTELRNAYKKLALKWHPDRCSASENPKTVEEAKKKFQDIQQAYSVLSDSNKRLMYDIGAYDGDDDENGMGDFLNEMAAMMSQTKPSEEGEESFEDLKELFEEMFESEVESYSSSTFTASATCSASTSYTSYREISTTNKRHSSQMSSERSQRTNTVGSSSGFNAYHESFCLGAEYQEKLSRGREGGGGTQRGASGRRRHGRKQKVSSDHDVSSYD